MEHKCIYCGVIFQSRQKNSTNCWSKACTNQYNRERYHSRKKEKECKLCESTFDAKEQESLCRNCKEKRSAFTVGHGTYVEGSVKMSRDILCKYCDVFIGTDTVLRKYKQEAPVRNRACDKCKADVYSALSMRVMGENNPNWRGGVSKLPKMTKAEFSKASSTRMKKNNPMKNADVRKRMSLTLKQRYASGDIKKVYGNDHWLWKGNRDRAQTIRSRLYKVWILPIMRRDNFTCTRCGRSDCYLEVHHVDTFSSVLKMFFGNKSLSLFSDEEFNRLSIDVVESHRDGHVNGVTLCRSCHRKTEQRSNSENKKNNEAPL